MLNTSDNEGEAAQHACGGRLGHGHPTAVEAQLEGCRITGQGDEHAEMGAGQVNHHLVFTFYYSYTLLAELKLVLFTMANK